MAYASTACLLFSLFSYRLQNSFQHYFVSFGDGVSLDRNGFASSIVSPQRHAEDTRSSDPVFNTNLIDSVSLFDHRLKSNIYLYLSVAREDSFITTEVHPQGSM